MASRKSSSRGSSKSVSVDLSEVEVGRRALPEGIYTVEVVSAKKGTSAAKEPKIDFEFKVTEGKNKGAKLWETASLQPQALFKLKQILVAAGVEIPKKAFDLNLESLVGLELQVETTQEIYEGKKKSRIVEFLMDQEDEEEGDLEETLGGMDLSDIKELAGELNIKLKGKKKADLIEAILAEDEDKVWELLGEEVEEEEDDEEDEEEEDYSEWSLADLKAEAKDRDLKIPKNAKKPALIKLLEEDDEED